MFQDFKKSSHYKNIFKWWCLYIAECLLCRLMDNTDKEWYLLLIFLITIVRISNCIMNTINSLEVLLLWPKKTSSKEKQYTLAMVRSVIQSFFSIMALFYLTINLMKSKLPLIYTRKMIHYTNKNLELSVPIKNHKLMLFQKHLILNHGNKC